MPNDEPGRYPIRPVIDHLASVGLLDAKLGVNERRVNELPFRHLVDLGVFIASPTEWKREGLANAPSPFIQSSSISLAGGSDTCAEIECRLQRVRALGRYAAAIADRVYVHNPFSVYLPTANGDYDIRDSPKLRENFVADLVVLLQVAPLIEEGLVVPFPSEEHYCHYCLAQDAFGEDANERLKTAIDGYRRRFRDQTKVMVSRAHPGFTIRLRAPETVLAHGGSVFDVPRLPRSLARLRTVKRGLASGREVAIPLAVSRRLRLSNEYAALTLRTIRYGLLTTVPLGAAYVTDALAEIEILGTLASSQEALNRNRILARHLTSVIPFLNDVDPVDLVRLRRAEPEAFVAYRRALGDALSSVTSMEPSRFTAADARSIYGDLIEPELTRLQQRVKEARRAARRASVRSAAGWGAALSFGLYSGIVPAELAGAVKALGLTKVIGDILSHFGAIRDAESAVRQENFYFLWRAKRISTRRLPDDSASVV